MCPRILQPMWSPLPTSWRPPVDMYTPSRPPRSRNPSTISLPSTTILWKKLSASMSRLSNSKSLAFKLCYGQERRSTAKKRRRRKSGSPVIRLSTTHPNLFLLARKLLLHLSRKIRLGNPHPLSFLEAFPSLPTSSSLLLLHPSNNLPQSLVPLFTHRILPPSNRSNDIKLQSRPASTPAILPTDSSTIPSP